MDAKCKMLSEIEIWAFWGLTCSAEGGTITLSATNETPDTDTQQETTTMLARYALLAPANDNLKISCSPAVQASPAPVILSIVAPHLLSSVAPPAFVSSVHLDRDEAIRRIKAGLKARSGKSWSVTGGRGTAWGWIEINTMPARRKFDWEGNPTDSEFGYMSKDEREELATLLGLNPVRMSPQGESIPSGSHYREEFVARAEGRTPERFGEQYWD